MRVTPEHQAEIARPWDGMLAAFQRQREAFAADMLPSLQQRLDRLQRLQAALDKHADGLVRALSADFGNRSAHETRFAELLIVGSAIRHASRHLKAWMRPRRVATALHFRPGHNRLLPQPLGVVGIVSPWNYPLQLALSPAVAALAAGNRVMIKPSELAPRFADLLARALGEFFAPDEVSVVTGDADIGRRFVELPFDHLLFTGSTPVGRLVAQAAAKNLTPVTLELGGKSPVILDPSCDLETSARRLAFGKLLNAGQTCIAPDYALVPRGRVPEVVEALRRSVARMYPTLAANPDYTSIVNDRHYARLQRLLDDAQARGARLVPLNPAGETLLPARRKFVPTLVLGATPEMAVMREEIFGPVLPLVEYDSLDDAIAHVNAGDRPLALYWFGQDKRNRDRVLRSTISGGVTVNDCLWHIVQEDQPFGGVGASGSGAYHGEWGFRTFSKEKPVFYQARLAGTAFLRPPYGKVFEGMLAVLRRIA